MHIIELKKINLHAYHGVMEQERKVGNTFIIDLKLKLDLSRAIASDCLEDTISYATVYELIKQEMNIPSDLLEHAAGRIITRIQNTFPQITGIELRLAKKNPPMGGDIQEAAIIINTGCY